MGEPLLRQFEKRPPGQYKTPEFYFRGGDVLKEQEFLRDEYKHALADLRSSQQQLQQVEHEVSKAVEILHEREGYTNALGFFLERDLTRAQKEAGLKRYSMKLEANVIQCHSTLEQLRKMQNPAVVRNLVKELEQYLTDIQRGQKDIETYGDQQLEAKRQIAACSVNSLYLQATALVHDLDRCLNKRDHLRSIVRQTKFDFESLRPAQYHGDPESGRERDLLRRSIPVTLSLYRLEERQTVRETKRNTQLNRVLGDIEELNARMQDIGLGDDVIDVESLRKEMIHEVQHIEHRPRMVPRPPRGDILKPAPNPRNRKIQLVSESSETKESVSSKDEEEDEQVEDGSDGEETEYEESQNDGEETATSVKDGESKEPSQSEPAKEELPESGAEEDSEDDGEEEEHGDEAEEAGSEDPPADLEDEGGFDTFDD
jgi:hypothetical protein